jgi:serine/threonine-protein kinase
MANRTEQTPEARQVEAPSRLQGAMAHSPDLPEAHAALAALYRERHEEAERRRDEAQALRAEALLRAHAEALPVSSAVRAGHQRYLQGVGRLTIETIPAGAQAKLFRYGMNRQRLVPEFVRELGQTPLLDLPVAQGSWLVELSHPGRATVRYPVQIGRRQHWKGVPPGAKKIYAVDLPLEEQLGPDDIYVPAGWFLRGGDSDAPSSLPRASIWLDAFVIQRLPVTNRAYLRFLNDLIQRGREEEATQHVPRERSGLRRSTGTQLYARDSNGLFQLEASQSGEWKLDWPVLMVDWSGASAYARWFRIQSGQPWRLPMSDEWSKAARGVDGRFYPWGDSFDPSWCAMRDSVHESELSPVAVGSFPVDESPFGVRDMAGSAKDWCLDGMRGGRRAVRGGFWRGDATRARVASRQEYDPSTRTRHLSFRLARAFPMTTI